MEFLLHFHVFTHEKQALVNILRTYSGIQPVIQTEVTDDIQDAILSDLNADPDYFIVNGSPNGWVGVECNSFSKLRTLGQIISSELNTQFIQSTYSREGAYLYFLLIDRGTIKREIEADENHAAPRINEGELLAFEREDMDWENVNELEAFDLDLLAHYCQRMGIDLSNLWPDEEVVVLDKKGERDTVYNVKKETLKVFRDIEIAIANRMSE